MIEQLKEAAQSFKHFLEENPNKRLIRIITHIDTDGLTAGAIFIKMLERANENFWLSTVKQLEEETVKKLAEETKSQEWKAVVFLDLGSNALDSIEKIPCFTLVLDHHEVHNRVQLQKTLFVNPSLEEDEEKISAAGITYLFAKEFDSNNRELAQLAVLGMVGDLLENSISKYNNVIIEDAKQQGLQLRKGPIIFSSTRPLHKALEFSSDIFIPGVSGSFGGATELLREAGIEYKKGNSYKTLLDLTREEISRLTTSILLRRIRGGHDEDILGNIYLIKLFGNLEDARELSAIINACGRLGYSDIALSFLIGARKAKYLSQEIYDKYKLHIIRALNYIENCEKIKGDGYMIINARDSIKDTIIGTALSILSSSSVYPSGTIMVGLAYSELDKIKISARITGNRNEEPHTNLAELMKNIIKAVGGEFGGHKRAAGGIIQRDKEKLFIELIERELKLTEVSIKI